MSYAANRRKFLAYSAKTMATTAAIAGLGLEYASSRVPPVYADSAFETTIIAPTSTYPLTVDGKWTNPEEWSDAVEASALGNSWRVKHTPGDAGCIQVLFDFVKDTELNASPDTGKCDGIGIRIDTKSDGGLKPKPDDYGFILNWLSPDKPTLTMQQGTGSGWKDVELLPSFSGASSMDASNDPNSTVAHLIYELQIPKSILRPNASYVYWRLGMNDGKYWSTYSKSGVIWPFPSDRDNPNTWSKLELSQNTIPEIPLPWREIVSAGAVGSAAGILAFNKRRFSRRAFLGMQ